MHGGRLRPVVTSKELSVVFLSTLVLAKADVEPTEAMELLAIGQSRGVTVSVSVVVRVINSVVVTSADVDSVPMAVVVTVTVFIG